MSHNPSLVNGQHTKGIPCVLGTNPFLDHKRIARVFFKEPALLRWQFLIKPDQVLLIRFLPLQFVKIPDIQILIFL